MRSKKMLAWAAAAVMAMATAAGLQPDVALAATNPMFVVPDSSSSVGTLPLDVEPADFNGDGLIDVAIANNGPGTVFQGGVAVLLGDGAGNLGTGISTSLPSNWGAAELAAADFNADGKADAAAIASTTGGFGPIFVLLSNGDGTFTVGQQIANSAQGQVVAGDVNGDGKADLAFSSNDTATVKVYLGNGNGTFGAATTYSNSLASYDFVATDADGDGDLDLAGASGGAPWVMLNLGNGTFAPQVSTFSGQLSGIALTLGDFNGDGIADVGMVDASGGHLDIGLGTGDGHFTPFKQFSRLGLQINSLTSGDFTGDGRIDVVTDGESAISILFRGRGDGNFRGPFRFVTGSEDVTAASLNADTRTDLVAFSSDPGTIYSSLGVAKGFSAPTLTPTTVGGIMRAGDLNNDGRMDLAIGGGVVFGGLRSVVATHLGQGGGRFGKANTSVVRTESAGSGLAALELADVNADGKLDAVGGFSNLFPSPSNLFVMLGNGNGTFGTPLLFSNGDTNADITSIAAADVNADGKLDIVSHTLAKVNVNVGNGDGTFGPGIASGSSGPDQAATLVADFTGDGKPDVVAVIVTGGPDVSSSDLRLHRGNGDGTFTLVQTVTVDTNVANGETADLNGDGRPDIAVIGLGGSNGGRTGMYVSLGQGSALSSATFYARGGGGLAIADYNLDGSRDIASSSLFVNVNAGGGTFVQSILLVATSMAGVAADFTGDGKPDIVTGGSAFTSPAFALYVNASA